MTGRRYELDVSKVDWREVEGEIVALHHGRSAYLGINQTGAALWPQLLEGATFEDMCRTLVDRYGIDEQHARRDVTAFVEMLGEHGLLAGEGPQG